MKKHFCLLVLAPFLAGWAVVAPDSFAQNSAAAANEREVAEDAYKRLSASIRTLEENQAMLQQQISALEKGLADLRQEVVRANNNAVTQDSLRRLAEQIRKVDEARVAENKRIQDTLDELHHLLKTAAAPTPPPRSPTPPPTANSAGPSGDEEGFWYVVQKNDALYKIVQAYREQGIKVNSKMVMDANPNVKWDRLQVNQKIFIPKPKK